MLDRFQIGFEDDKPFVERNCRPRIRSQYPRDGERDKERQASVSSKAKRTFSISRKVHMVKGFRGKLETKSEVDFKNLIPSSSVQQYQAIFVSNTKRKIKGKKKGPESVYQLKKDKNSIKHRPQPRCRRIVK